MGFEVSEVYEGASGNASSFWCRRLVDSWRHCVSGVRDGFVWRGIVRRRVLQVDIACEVGAIAVCCAGGAALMG